MFKKMKLKTMMAVVMTTMALSSGTVMAMSEIMPYAAAESGSETLSAGGKWKTIAGGKTYPSPDFARVYVNRSTKQISAEYPLYFKLVREEDVLDFSSVAKMVNMNYPVSLHYKNNDIGVQFRFNARTDKEAVRSTTIGYTVSF